MTSPDESGFFRLQGLLFDRIAACLSVREAETTLAEILKDHVNADFAEPFHVDRLRDVATPWGGGGLHRAVRARGA